MKYIRTEDEHIYEIEIKVYGGVRKGYFKTANDDFNFHHNLREWQLDCKNQYYLTTPNGFTVCKKQADTIEELCDEIYFVEKNTNMPLVVRRLDELFDKDKKLTECFLEIGGWVTYLKRYSRIGCIKGAIFTEKGIIYVAEMNEQGEFELL